MVQGSCICKKRKLCDNAARSHECVHDGQGGFVHLYGIIVLTNFAFD